MLLETTKVFDVDKGLEEEGVILLLFLSLVEGIEAFCLRIVLGESGDPLLLVLTGKASCSSSLSEVGRIKSQSP